MDKKGEFTLIIAIVSFLVVVGSIVGGTYIITKEGSQIDLSDVYVGNIETNMFYNFDCINDIQEENRVFFESHKQAKKLNFTYVDICPK